MEMLLTVVGTLCTVGVPAYIGVRKIINDHREKMKALETDHAVKMAEVEAKLKTAEDARQNEAFDRLKQSFDTLQKMFDDLLTRTQTLEKDHKLLKDEHATCQKTTDELKKEIASLKKGVTNAQREIHPGYSVPT